jgi:CheY-like chemotaxis protein
MRELIGWLITVEDLAGRFYADAGAHFKADREFSDFLHYLAEDEAWHVRLMERAVEYAAVPVPPVAITLDNATKARIETPFLACRKELEAAVLSREMLLQCIITTEYSEWNDIFLYVVNTLKEHNREFADAAAKLHQHKKHIERYFTTISEGRAYLEQIQRLPAVWKEKILVVEDYPVLQNFLADVLSSEGEISIAANGKEGLGLSTKQHFDVIVSDVQMPVMNGIEFFRQASSRDPGLKERFLFLTGNPTDESRVFFEQNHLRCLVKPVPLQELLEAVRAIIRRTRTMPGGKTLP